MTSILTRLDKITEKFKAELLQKETELLKDLESGDFRSFEQSLKGSCEGLANELTKSVLEAAMDSDELEKKAKQVAQAKGLQIRKTTVQIRIWTGAKIKVPS